MVLLHWTVPKDPFISTSTRQERLQSWKATSTERVLQLSRDLFPRLYLLQSSDFVIGRRFCRVKPQFHLAHFGKLPDSGLSGHFYASCSPLLMSDLEMGWGGGRVWSRKRMVDTAVAGTQSWVLTTLPDELPHQPRAILNKNNFSLARYREEHRDCSSSSVSLCGMSL